MMTKRRSMPPFQLATARSRLDTVAELDGKILFLLAFKLNYTEGRKVYVTTLDIPTNEMY
jgi:hypothetical protein